MLALRHPELVDRLVVVDIAPKGYGSLERFEGYIREMQALPLGELTSRGDAEARFTEPDRASRRSCCRTCAVTASLALAGQPRPHRPRCGPRRGTRTSRTGRAPSTSSRPTTARCWESAGGDSRYVKREDGDRMRRHSRVTRLFTIKGAGHWVHTDAPEIIVTALRRFCSPTA